MRIPVLKDNAAETGITRRHLRPKQNRVPGLPDLSAVNPACRLQAVLAAVQRRIDADEITVHHYTDAEMQRKYWTPGSNMDQVADRRAECAVLCEGTWVIENAGHGHHYAGVPLRLGTRLLGVLGVVREDAPGQTSFTAPELEQLHMCGAWIVTEMDRERLFRDRDELIGRLQTTIERLRGLYQRPRQMMTAAAE